MKSDPFVDELLERLAPLGELRAKRMFGAVGLYCDEVFFGVIDSDVLFFRVDEESVEDYRAAGSEPFRPMLDRPPMLGYFEVPLAVQEDDGKLREWAGRAREASRRKAKKKTEQNGTTKKKSAHRARPKGDSLPVSKLLNIGPKSAAWLRAIGIETRSDLESVGSVQAFRRLGEEGIEHSLNLLYALEGALMGLHWNRLSEAVKRNLRERSGR